MQKKVNIIIPSITINFELLECLKKINQLLYKNFFVTIVLNYDSKVKLPKKHKTWGEAELGVVIKKKCKQINIKNVNNYILGFIPANDITCDNYENIDHHLAFSKSADGFCPVGEYIDTEYKYNNKNLEIACKDSILLVKQIQIEGKKKISAHEFINNKNLNSLTIE